MTQEVWNKIINSEMLLIGIGTQLSVKEDNEKQIDEVYDTLAKLAKGRNCFVITSNTDQKLLDGRISKFLTAHRRWPDGSIHLLHLRIWKFIKKKQRQQQMLRDTETK